MKSNFLKIFLLALLPIAVASCVPNTPEVENLPVDPVSFTYRIIGDSISQLSDENAKKDYDENIVEKLNNYNINEEGKAYFFILAPDYNMPETYKLKGYSPLYYSTLVGIVKDKKDEQVVALMKKYHKNHENENLWSAFYNAMKRHSYKDESLSLYEDMKNTFFTRIKELREKSND